MKSVILAAGKSKRFGGIGQKCMGLVKDKPLLERNIKLLSKYSSEVIVIVGHQKDSIKEYLGDKCRFVEQEETLGTAHAIGLVKDIVDGDFIVLNGDVLIHENDIVRLVKKEPVCISVYPVDKPWRYGVVEISNNLIKSIIEKPPKGEEPSNLINAGVYLFDNRIFDAIKRTKLSERGEYEITDSLKILMHDRVDIKPLLLKKYAHITTINDLVKVNKEGF